MSAVVPTLRRALPRPPVRMVHLGLGAFHRAHQAWYTAAAAPDWGIAAFTGRRPDAAALLHAQDCVYTLIERSDDGDRIEQVESIVQAHDAADLEALCDLVSRPAVSVITLTITEQGHHLAADGRLDEADLDVSADAAALRPVLTRDEALPDTGLRTALGRLVCALHARHTAGAGPINVIPCDNLTANGPALAAALRRLIELAGADTAWFDDTVDVISTSVDRITPRTTTTDIEQLLTRHDTHDATPVITEPFHSWVLSGRFRAPRPAWERAGALIVDDVAPFERRKLWMLNGAHSLLAYEGLLRGHETVAQAIADPACLTLVRALWDLDARHLPNDRQLGLDQYRADLERRFANGAIAHSLRQIATDGSAKLRNRVREVILREREAGGTAAAGVAVLAAWVRFVQAELAAGRPIDDVDAAPIAHAASAEHPVRALLAIVAPDLAADVTVVRQVQDGYTWNDD